LKVEAPLQINGISRRVGDSSLNANGKYIDLEIGGTNIDLHSLSLAYPTVPIECAVFGTDGSQTYIETVSFNTNGVP